MSALDGHPADYATCADLWLRSRPRRRQPAPRPAPQPLPPAHSAPNSAAPAPGPARWIPPAPDPAIPLPIPDHHRVEEIRAANDRARERLARRQGGATAGRAGPRSPPPSAEDRWIFDRAIERALAGRDEAEVARAQEMARERPEYAARLGYEAGWHDRGAKAEATIAALAGECDELRRAKGALEGQLGGAILVADHLRREREGRLGVRLRRRVEPALAAASDWWRRVVEWAREAESGPWRR